MRSAVRSYATAGIALVGAGVVALAPIAPPPADVPIAGPAVRLAVNPVEVYAQLTIDTISNTANLITTAWADPFPVNTQFLINQAVNSENLQTALDDLIPDTLLALISSLPDVIEALGDLVTGDVQGAIDNLVAAAETVLAPTLAVPAAAAAVFLNPLKNLINVFNLITPVALAATGIGVVGPAISFPGASRVALQNVTDAIGGGDPVELIKAVVAAPGIVADGLLNGGYGPNLADIVAIPDVDEVYAGGLINPRETTVTPGTPPTVKVVLSGPIDTFLQVRLAIADAITPEEDSTVAPVAARSRSGAEGAGSDVVANSGTDAGQADAATDLSDGNKVTSPDNRSAADGPGKRVRSAVHGARDQVRGAVKGIGDTVRGVTGRGSGGDKAGAA